jgi:transposase
VFRFHDELKVYLHRDPVDFRCGINSLSILVEQAMHLSPMAPALFVFGNRRRDRIKILGVWPDSETAVVTMSVELLHWLVDGVDIAALEGHRKRNYLRVS